MHVVMPGNTAMYFQRKRPKRMNNCLSGEPVLLKMPRRSTLYQVLRLTTGQFLFTYALPPELQMSPCAYVFGNARYTHIAPMRPLSLPVGHVHREKK